MPRGRRKRGRGPDTSTWGVHVRAESRIPETDLTAWAFVRPLPLRGGSPEGA